MCRVHEPGVTAPPIGVQGFTVEASGNIDCGVGITAKEERERNVAPLANVPKRSGVERRDEHVVCKAVDDGQTVRSEAALFEFDVERDVVWSRLEHLGEGRNRGVAFEHRKCLQRREGGLPDDSCCIGESAEFVVVKDN